MQDILTQLRTIFDLIIDFQTAQSEFYEEANDELQARQHYDKLQQMRSQKVCSIQDENLNGIGPISGIKNLHFALISGRLGFNSRIWRRGTHT